MNVRYRSIQKLMAILLALVLLGTLLTVPAVAKESELPFTDVPQNTWYFSAAEYVYSHGIMTGTGATTFQPGLSMSRAMFVTVIYRHSGERNTTANVFSDVPNGSWYSQAVSWAAAKGIVAGVDEHRFNPMGDITREQMTCMLYNYATVYGYVTAGTANLATFTDSTAISGYAVAAVNWALAHGFISGTSKNTLSPRKTATRAEAATILMKFCKKDQYTGCGITGDEKVVVLGNRSIEIGMKAEEVTNALGRPTETLKSVHGFSWKIYHTADYKTFYAVGTDGGAVVAIYAEGTSFTYMGYKGFTRFPEASAMPRTFNNGTGAQIDRMDGNCMYAVYIRADRYRYEGASTEILRDEARLKFHLINAYRATQGLPALQWDAATAAISEQHSCNMKDDGFVSHTTPEGMTFTDRMDAGSIPWRSCGENIVVGTLDAVEAHNRLLNSEGHRENILSEKFKYIGVGTAYTANVYYVFYFTEVFWG